MCIPESVYNHTWYTETIHLYSIWSTCHSATPTCLPYDIEFVIGFEMEDYTVTEGTATVEVCAVVMVPSSGTFPDTSLLLESAEESATGAKYTVTQN